MSFALSSLLLVVTLTFTLPSAQTAVLNFNETCLFNWIVQSGIQPVYAIRIEWKLRQAAMNESMIRHLSPSILALIVGDAAVATNLKACIGGLKEDCVDYNPCEAGGVCSFSAERKKNVCQCRRGLHGDLCKEDCDECSRDCALEYSCPKLAACVNTHGSYTCECNIGFAENRSMSEGWLNTKYFETTKTEHADISAKVTENKAANAKILAKVSENHAQSKQIEASIASILAEVAENKAQTKQTQALISAVLQKTTSLEDQLKNMTEKIGSIIVMVSDGDQLKNKTEKVGNISDDSTAVLGNMSSSPGLSCLEIRNSRGNQGDGFYWIKPTPYSGSPYRAYCDMTTLGGGWTLFATKVSYNFHFPTTTFNPSSASSITSNAKGCIHPGTNWSEVLFRFGPKPSPVQTIYSRHGGTASVGKTEFNKYLECADISSTRKVAGFVKYSPHVNGGKRFPKTGYAEYPSFEYTRAGIWGHFWIDLYQGTWAHGSYPASDSSLASGSKCVAEVCYLNRPVWLMYR